MGQQSDEGGSGLSSGNSEGMQNSEWLELLASIQPAEPQRSKPTASELPWRTWWHAR